MALPKIDTPIYEIELPLSKKQIRFRPFLVKEQKNLLMAMESDDSDTIERNIRQVLHNCTLTENINIDKLPVVDIEYYFLHLRARSIGEIVEGEYICNNQVEDKNCGGKMKTSFNLLDIKVDMNPEHKDIIQLTNNVSIKLKYPEFSLVQKLKNKESAVDIAFEVIADSIDYVFDGEQYYYGNETPREEMVQFLESLNQNQFASIESFFDNLPIISKKVEMRCGKCGFNHTLNMEGLESFFG
jgi:hypothetical protein